jgi:hypothetical protein
MVICKRHFTRRTIFLHNFIKNWDYFLRSGKPKEHLGYQDVERVFRLAPRENPAIGAKPLHDSTTKDISRRGIQQHNNLIF